MKESFVERKCIVCNKITSRDELIKVTKNKDNVVCVMPNSRFFGRSAYICKTSECVEKAFKKDKLFKLLKISPNDSLKEKIRAVLES